MILVSNVDPYFHRMAPSNAIIRYLKKNSKTAKPKQCSWLRCVVAFALVFVCAFVRLCLCFCVVAFAFVCLCFCVVAFGGNLR